MPNDWPGYQFLIFSSVIVTTSSLAVFSIWCLPVVLAPTVRAPSKPRSWLAVGLSIRSQLRHTGIVFLMSILCKRHSILSLSMFSQIDKLLFVSLEVSSSFLLPSARDCLIFFSKSRADLETRRSLLGLNVLASCRSSATRGCFIFTLTLRSWSRSVTSHVDKCKVWRKPLDVRNSGDE